MAVSRDTSSHKQRQTPSPIDVHSDTTSAALKFRPFSDYTVDVNAVFAPPPDTVDVVVPLLPTTFFSTPERRKFNNSW